MIAPTILQHLKLQAFVGEGLDPPLTERDRKQEEALASMVKTDFLQWFRFREGQDPPLQI